MKKIVGLFISVVLFAACAGVLSDKGSEENEREPKVKNIILMIGDGMGTTQITAGMYRNGNYLNLERFPFMGLIKTHADDNLITDSAASATAYACGQKTYNGAIGVNRDTLAMKTILEIAEENGLATGMVATSTIVHATPASFISHQKNRKMYEEIALDFMSTEIDLMIGGGKKYFDRREDNRNLLEELRAKGYVVKDFLGKDLEDVEIASDKNFAYLTSDSDPLPQMQGRNYLVPATTKSIDFLSEKGKEKGFFLMIEGSQIDWGGHANDGEYIVTEMIEFDNAVGKVLDFAEKDKETLVIVTADHETGGFAINPKSTLDSTVAAFTTDYHTAAMVPVFSYGPGADKFGGIYDNTLIFNKLMEAFGFR